MNSRPVITLLTDFGATDHYVGVMKGVMLGICPHAQLVDITHESTPYSIPEAAFTLSQSWIHFPRGTVHLVVVDPGVGSSRRPIVAAAGGHYFVAPDNGVLTMILDAASQVREITAERFFRQPVSQTFHGRDIFSPVAAHLANGTPASDIGPVIVNCERLNIASPVLSGPNFWTCAVLKVDRFGNLITNIPSDLWPELVSGQFTLRLGNSVVCEIATTYADAVSDRLFVIRGSSGFLEISLNRGSAATLADVRSGETIEMRLRPA